MIHLKDTTAGLDGPIQRFQQFLYTQLKKKWPVNDENYECYGRCYRNQVDAGYVPEVFVNSSSDNNTIYKQVFFDDTRCKALSFFDAGDSVKFSNGSAVAPVHLIFIVNVAQLKPVTEYTHRADEEIRRDVQLLCDMPRYGFEMKEMVTGYKNVFSRFDGLLKKDQVTFRDLHPLHCFRISFDLLYNIQDC